LAVPVEDIILKYYPIIQSEARQRITEEENVLCQLYNVQTYPFVQEALNAGVLYLHGWCYNIKIGKIYAYDTDADMFK
jgi:carbonic anhydrase